MHITASPQRATTTGSTPAESMTHKGKKYKQTASDTTPVHECVSVPKIPQKVAAFGRQVPCSSWMEGCVRTCMFPQQYNTNTPPPHPECMHFGEDKKTKKQNKNHETPSTHLPLIVLSEGLPLQRTQFPGPTHSYSWFWTLLHSPTTKQHRWP